MSKNLFENNVNLIIADASINVCKKTDFSNYNTFANYILDSLRAKNFEPIEKFLTPIVLEVSNIMGMNIMESATYVSDYFKNQKWEKYQPIVKLIKDQFSIYLVS